MLSLTNFQAFGNAAKALGASRLTVDLVNETFTVDFAEGNGQPPESLVPEKKLPAGTEELADLLNVPADSNFHLPGKRQVEE